MNFEEIQQRSRELFRVEAADLLRELEEALLALEADPASGSLINRVFRVMHTLKGSGATSGFEDLSSFLHRVEDVFNAARENRIAVTSDLIDRTLKIGDVVARYLAAAPADAAAVLTNASDELAAILAYLPNEKPAAPAASALTAKPDAPVATTPSYAIRFHPHPGLFRSGGDPGMFLDDLRALGECTVRASSAGLPKLSDLDPEDSYLSWEIELTTDAPESAIRDVFAFIDGECDLEISRRNEPASTTVSQSPRDGAEASARAWHVEFQATERTLSSPGVLDALWKDFARFGTVTDLVEPAPRDGRPAPGLRTFRIETSADDETIRSAFVFLLDADPKVTPEQGAPAARPLSAPSDGAAVTAATQVPPRTGTPNTPAPKSKGPAPREAAPAAQPKAAAHNANDMLRVSAERLDRLVNLVGELVILRSQVKTACAQLEVVPPALQGASEALQSLSTEMRDVVLNIRMMPVEQTFAKFHRIVRDLSRDLGKDVQFVVEGGETEMDKTVLDALADPLVHLVRNSLDHGLETPADRVAAGKPARGTLTLRAEQSGDRVFVIVRDDGRGLDPDKIRARAIEKGLLAPEANPTDAELFNLIFLPGFSTAAKVSHLSGRGVGLDVVRRQIDQLRGRVELHSERGKGTEFRLSLPLTLAIIDGLLVELDGECYVLPLGSAREAIDLPRATRVAGNGRNVVAVRGELVPYVRLRDVFGCTSESPDPERVVLVDVDDKRLGIVVDGVIGNHQTVLKSLGWVGRRVTLFSGATVLGDGRIALILDVPALLTQHRREHGSGRGLEI